MKLLIDTNVFFDVITKREPFYGDSYSVLHYAAKNNTGYISVQSLKDLYYLCSKGNGAKDSWEIIEKISYLFNVIDISSDDSTSTLNSDMPDYEDGLILMSAIRNGMDAIVTRDEHGFHDTDLIVFHPKDAGRYLNSKIEKGQMF